MVGLDGRHEGVGVVGEVVLGEDVDDDGALDARREGVLLSVPGLLGKVGGVVPRDVLEGVPLLGGGEMTFEQAGRGAGKFLDESVVFCRVNYESSHVLSFAVKHGYPAGIEGDLI
jgi:hypothetical protein